MERGKLRLWVAGLVAFVVGVPLTERAFGQVTDIIWSSIGLAGAIIDSAGDS